LPKHAAASTPQDGAAAVMTPGASRFSVIPGAKTSWGSMLPACWLENPARIHPARFDGYDLLDWPVIKDGLARARDFDDALYLELNRILPA